MSTCCAPLTPRSGGDLLACARQLRGRTSAREGGTDLLAGELGRIWGVPVAPSFAPRLAHAARRADLLHVHSPNPLGEAAALVAGRSLPLVVTVHADVVRQARALPAYTRMMRRLLGRAGAILAGSHGLAATSPLLAAHRDRVQVIPYGVDLERFDRSGVPASDRDAVRERLGSPLIVSVGRLVYYKGFEYLVEAASRLDASLAIIGSGPLEGRLRELTARMPRAHVVGAVDDAALRAHLAAADVFVLASTSRAESFGLATLEAQAMEIPAIVTDVGSGTLEAIEPGRTGIAVPPRDADALTRGDRRAARRRAAPATDGPVRRASGSRPASTRAGRPPPSRPSTGPCSAAEGAGADQRAERRRRRQPVDHGPRARRLELRGGRAAGGHGEAADPHGPGAVDVVRRVADHERPLRLDRRVVVRLRPRDGPRRDPGARAAVHAEGASVAEVARPARSGPAWRGRRPPCCP